MYFCILFGVLVVGGIVTGIGIHFARIPNRNSGEVETPNVEGQVQPKTGMYSHILFLIQGSLCKAACRVIIP